MSLLTTSRLSLLIKSPASQVLTFDCIIFGSEASTSAIFVSNDISAAHTKNIFAIAFEKTKHRVHSPVPSLGNTVKLYARKELKS